MPITIQHGVPASAGLSGLAQTAMQIQAQKEAAALAAAGRGGSGGGGSRGGGSRGGGGGGGSDVALRAFYQGKAAEQEFDLRNRQLEYEQSLKEQGFDYEYTARAKQELATFNNSLQMINASNELSEEEKITARRSVELQRAGVEKSVIPADPNKKEYPEGEGPGDSYIGKDGSYRTRNPGDGREVVLTPYEKTPEGIQAQWDYDQREDRSKWARELLVTEVEKLVDGKMVKERMSAPEVAKIYRAERESQIEMDKVDRELQEEQERLVQEQEREIQDEQNRMEFMQNRMEEASSPDFWIKQAQEAGLQLTQEDVDLGPENGPKRATLRQLHKKRRLNSTEEQEMKQLTKDLLYAAGETEAADAIVVHEPPTSAKKGGLKKRKSSDFARSFGGVTGGF